MLLRRKEVASIRLVYLCPRLGTPDHDRCNALVESGFDVTVVDVIEDSIYKWDLPSEALYKRCSVVRKGGALSGLSTFVELFQTVFGLKASVLVVYGYQKMSFLMLSIIAKIIGILTISINDSKFDDYDRNLLREIVKWFYLVPYDFFIAATKRAQEYLVFFGKRRSYIYNCAVDIRRTIALAATSYAAAAWEDRYFLVIARFEKSKNYPLILDVYERYLQGSKIRRRLVVCGYGVLEKEVKKIIESSELLTQYVDIVGYMPSAEIPGVIGGAIALLLPSSEEKFGIVVTEAMAAGIPAIISTNCGAADIVRTGISGFVLDASKPDTFAMAMLALEADETDWRRFSVAAAEDAWAAHVDVFSNAVVNGVAEGTAPLVPARTGDRF